MTLCGKKFALEEGLGENASWKDISNHQSEIRRKKDGLEYGLGENATWKEISNHLSEIRRKQDGLEYGSWMRMPHGRKFPTISLKFVGRRMDYEYGLGENATWKEISEHQSEIRRKQDGLRLGLGENATWEEISAKI